MPSLVSFKSNSSICFLVYLEIPSETAAHIYTLSAPYSYIVLLFEFNVNTSVQVDSVMLNDYFSTFELSLNAEITVTYKVEKKTSQLKTWAIN